MIGVRSSSSLPIVAKNMWSKALFVSRISPQVTASGIEKSLREQLKLASLACTRLKTKFYSYAFFHVSVAEDDLPLINNTGVWLSGGLIASFYGHLSADQIYSVVNSDLPSLLHLVLALMLPVTLLLAQTVLWSMPIFHQNKTRLEAELLLTVPTGRPEIALIPTDNGPDPCILNTFLSKWQGTYNKRPWLFT
jgi:hypothetical protein